jgi:hypothetical protein
MQNMQTKKLLKKWHHKKAIVLLLTIVVGIILFTMVITLSVYVRDHEIDKPLGPDFVYIQQEIIRSPAVPTQTFYYATDTPPQDFASKFSGWKTDSISGLDKASTRTVVRIMKGSQDALIRYCSVDQCSRDPLSVSDFKGKKYLVTILGTSMYFLNPNNIDPSMKQQVLNDIRNNYIR